MKFRIRHRPTPDPCACGSDYDDLRTGMTYKEVRRGMDPDRWRGRRRRAVLGYWREMKLGLWDSLHDQCEETVLASAIDPTSILRWSSERGDGGGGGGSGQARVGAAAVARSRRRRA